MRLRTVAFTFSLCFWSVAQAYDVSMSPAMNGITPQATAIYGGIPHDNSDSGSGGSYVPTVPGTPSTAVPGRRSRQAVSGTPLDQQMAELVASLKKADAEFAAVTTELCKVAADHEWCVDTMSSIFKNYPPSRARKAGAMAEYYTTVIFPGVSTDHYPAGYQYGVAKFLKSNRLPESLQILQQDNQFCVDESNKNQASFSKKQGALSSLVNTRFIYNVDNMDLVYARCLMPDYLEAAQKFEAIYSLTELPSTWNPRQAYEVSDTDFKNCWYLGLSHECK